LILANAGHLAPYLNGEELVSPPELPLGLEANVIFSEQHFQFVHGDRLTLLTDGIPEATNQGELFGFERTVTLSSGPANTIAEPPSASGRPMT
jgi:serine phosphatase RsbU (regulator of sigma subunit)